MPHFSCAPIVMGTQSCAPVIEALDPERYTMYHLYRDSTKYIDGHHVKVGGMHVYTLKVTSQAV